MEALCGEGAQTRVLASRDCVELRTRRRVQFIDLTDLVGERVRRSGVALGLVSIQSLHTTAAVIVNEDEPMLLLDLEETLERLAPQGCRYAHDDPERRRGAPKDEPRNGDAHCRAAMLGSGATVHVVGRRLGLGTWQRIFLVELDGPRPRSVSVVVMGIADDRDP